MTDIKTALSTARTKALATIIAELINKNEPLLIAEAKGPEVTVREKGDKGIFQFSVKDVSDSGS